MKSKVVRPQKFMRHNIMRLTKSQTTLVFIYTYIYIYIYIFYRLLLLSDPIK